MGFSLGSLAGGVAQGLDPYLQMMAKQQQANQGLGQAGQTLAGMNGVNIPAQAQSPLAGLMSKLGIGGAQPPVQNAPPQQAQPQQSPLGGAQQPAPQQQQPPQQPQPNQGADPGAALKQAILGQESGNNDNVPNSPKGAQGPGQIMQGTFAQWAKPGEDIRDPAANRAVSSRMLDAYMRVYNDPQRAAVAYFSGPGNVAPAGSPTPWKEDKSDGRTSTSQYVAGVMGRMQGGGQQPQGQPPQAGQVQQMALADIVQAAKRANPNLSGLELMQQIGHILPVMNAQAQQQYHAVQQQLAQQRINQGEEKIQTTQRGQDLSHEDRQAGQSEKRREFDGRQERLKEQFAEKTRQFEEKLQTTQDMAERRNILGQANAAIKGQLSAERAEIDALKLPDGEEKTKLLKEAKDRAEEAKDRVEGAMKIKSVSDSSTSAAPGGKAPERAATPGAVGGYAPKPEEKPAQGKAPPPDTLAQAKEALQNGAPRDAVVAKLKELGFSDAGL